MKAASASSPEGRNFGSAGVCTISTPFDAAVERSACFADGLAQKRRDRMPTATRSAAGSLSPAPRPRAGNRIKRLRLLVCALAVTAAALLAPGAASASQSQVSLIQEDRELFGMAGKDPAEVMAEIKDLGVDVIRTNVLYYKVYTRPNQRRKPSGFDASDPNSPEYNWFLTDRLIDLAEANGIRVLVTISGPGPFFASSSPRRCVRVPCTYKPKASEFGEFAAAVAKRYRGRADYYAIYNEPNLVDWITPQQKKPGGGRVQIEGKIYRQLFIAGQRAIARFDPGRRNRVLFGETAAIGEPLSLMRSALCLDEEGRPFRGSLARRHGCGGRPAALNVGGFAIHPYNFGGYGTPRQRTPRETALPIAHIPRLHRVIDAARRYRRIRRRAPIYVTEFGFQTRPPDPSGRSPAKQAQYINESDRLLFADRRVAMVSQYEVTDPPERDQFNSGLRFFRGRAAKPSYQAYKVPIVVTRRSSGLVEVYGQVRPGGASTVQIQAARGGAQFAAVRSVRTNGRGVFRVNIRRRGAAGLRWRLATITPEGDPLNSRVARAGRPLRYIRD